MKKLSVIIIISMLLINIPFINVKAEDINCFKILSVSNADYSTDLVVMNGYINKNNVVYTGHQLKGMGIVSNVKKNSEIVYGTFTWENPEYTIVEGTQIVKAIFNGKEKVTFELEITPLMNAKEYSEVDYSDIIFERYEGSTLEEIVPVYTFWIGNGKKLTGTMTYSNYEDLSVGYHEIGWTFVPDDKSYKTKSGIYKVQIIPRPDTVETLDITELTTETLMLTETGSTYDVNVENSITGSTYTWSSSDTKVAKVNSKSGLITAVSDGEAEITCRIEKGADVQILSTEVIVGDNDNKVQLTETELDLEVGDLFDVDVENQISKSKIYWKSSNKSIAKVTSTTGKITALKSGTCTVTCIIRTPKKEVIVLQCEVIVD